MNCPTCGGVTSVTDSRPVELVNAVRRRRCCDVCGARFSTHELCIVGDRSEARETGGPAGVYKVATLLELSSLIESLTADDRHIAMTVLRRFSASQPQPLARERAA